MNKPTHITDRELLLLMDNELVETRAAEIQNHLSDCVTCRTRGNQLRDELTEFSDVVHTEFEPHAQAKDRSRAVLRARLSELASQSSLVSWWKLPLYAGCALAFVLVLGIVITHSRETVGGLRTDNEARLLPNPNLTPGSTRGLTKTEVCERTSPSMSHFISPSTGQHIFDEYGIGDPRPGGYELDYLIDPELGGSDDPHNLWPQPYSAVWNARVKDALEDHLHQLVCEDQLNLATAQHDVSLNWIAAYRKYFHTDKPILAHMAFTKDKPWNN